MVVVTKGGVSEATAETGLVPLVFNINTWSVNNFLHLIKTQYFKRYFVLCYRFLQKKSLYLFVSTRTVHLSLSVEIALVRSISSSVPCIVYLPGGRCSTGAKRESWCRTRNVWERSNVEVAVLGRFVGPSGTSTTNDCNTVHTLFVDPIRCGPAFANFLDQTLDPVDFALTSRRLHALLRGNRVLFELLKVNYLFMNLLP